MALINPHYNPDEKVPLKRSKTGVEAEFHLIDGKGNLAFKGIDVIDKVKKKHPNVPIVKEGGQNMVEFCSYPGVSVQNPIKNIIDSIQKTLDICADMDLSLFPFAAYPAKFSPKVSPFPRYELQKKVFGASRYANYASTVTGFHHHYTLPRGCFDPETKTLNFQKNSKTQRSMISSYNYEIAIDPALTLFSQCSPFFQGQRLGKDARVIAWRGGKKLNFPDGLFANFQQLGGLPPYKQTLVDLKSSLSKRVQRWKELVKGVTDTPLEELYPYELDITWNPVKINKHGTLEQRGMSMNLPSVWIGITTLLSFSLEKIQQDFIEALPTDFGLDEPFKLENGLLFLPPHTHVRNKLQKWSAYRGYKSKKSTAYAKRLFAFQKSTVPKEYRELIRPIEEMIENKKSYSDKILAVMKKRGWSEDDTISQEGAREFCLWACDEFKKDLSSVEKRMKDFTV